MPRVNRVAKARKAQGECICGAKIKVGDPYVWWKFNFGARHVRCAKPACAPKPSDLTQSEFLSTLYTIQERTFDGDISDLESQRDEVVGELEQLRDEQEEKRSNMPDSLQESDTGNMLQERYDALEDAINTLQNVDISLDDEEGPEEPDVKDEEAHAKWEKAHSEWEEECQNKCANIAEELSSALGDISV